MKKYELTENTKTVPSTVLFQIRAVRDFANVQAGDMGGWVAREENLSHDGDAWVYIDAQVSGNARVYGNAQVYIDAQVSGNARVYGNAQVYGDAHVSGKAQVYSNAQVSGDAQVSGNAQVYGDARVSGNAMVSGNAQVYGDTWDRSPLYIQGSRHALTISSHSEISIGCQKHTVEYWLENINTIGIEHGYSTEQISEYSEYIELAAQRMKALAGGEE